MASYSHDADVVVYNYTTRATEQSSLAAFLPQNPLSADPMTTEQISLRDAIVSIQCSKTKSSPQGSFMITLKPTQEWTKIIVPGSWCAIYMADRPLTTSDLNSNAIQDEQGNVQSPLKMIGVIMSVRVQKTRNGDGAFSMVYTISGYDFGYALTSSIYINYVIQPDVAAGKFQGVFSNLSFPKESATYANPAINTQRVLQGWSILSGSAIPGNLASDVSPPDIRMEIPEDVAKLVGSGTEVLQFISAAIGVDQRSNKVVTTGNDGQSPDFEFELVGEKFFMVWRLILHNTLWGMINEYLNPLLNEAYCDLHATKASSPLPIGGGITIKPMLIVRQIPFNTPDYQTIWSQAQLQGLATQSPYKVTKLNEIPKTILPQEKVISYEVGYSDYERTNFVEVNGFVIDGPKNGQEIGAFNGANKTSFEPGSVKRFGLRPKVFHGADYGVSKSRLDQAGTWRPLLVDWWFNANKYVNGTVECVGLIEHIALGENIEITQEKILAHIEGYSHNFSVDPESGLKMFRTSIDFVKGISSDSTSSSFKYIYGDATFGGTFNIANTVGTLTSQESSSFEDDVKQRSSFSKTNPQSQGSGLSLNSLKDKLF